MEELSSQGLRVLIIEDDAAINEVVAAFLTKKGFECTQAYSGSEASLLLKQETAKATTGSSTQDSTNTLFPYDVVITDLMLPGLQGQELVALVRDQHHVPIIVTSALDTPAQKVELFELGVDDYLTKPFDLDELYARILVQLRHKAIPASHNQHNSSDHTDQERTITHHRWTVKPQSRSLEVDGTPVKLTRLEYNIIEALITRPIKVFTKQELFEIAWSEECFVEEKAINVHISNIRSKLKETGTQDYIQTVWGIGFKLTDET